VADGGEGRLVFDLAFQVGSGVGLFLLFGEAVGESALFLVGEGAFIEFKGVDFLEVGLALLLAMLLKLQSFPVEVVGRVLFPLDRTRGRTGFVLFPLLLVLLPLFLLPLLVDLPTVWRGVSVVGFQLLLNFGEQSIFHFITNGLLANFAAVPLPGDLRVTLTLRHFRVGTGSFRLLGQELLLYKSDDGGVIGRTEGVFDQKLLD
jgi:hypothetical protein